MADNEQLTRHEREIGEMRGKLDALATKEFVRSVVQEQTKEMNKNFATVNENFASVNKNLRTLNEKQQRITGAADFLKAVLPMLISPATLAILFLSLLLAGR